MYIRDTYVETESGLHLYNWLLFAALVAQFFCKTYEDI